MTVVDRMPADDLMNRITSGSDRLFRHRRRRGVGRRGPPPRRPARCDGCLAHNYQLPAIQDIADHVGDSLALSRIAARGRPRTPSCSAVCTSWPRTAKILSPGQDGAHPGSAGRPARWPTRSPADDLRAWKAEHPGAVVVSYVNTTAAVKAETDICCTSSNAVEVVASIPADREVLFLPGPVPRRPRAKDHRPQEPARVGRRMPRARRHQRRRAGRSGSHPPGRRTLRAPRMRFAPLRLCI